jgi:hypothetical protein
MYNLTYNNIQNLNRQITRSNKMKELKSYIQSALQLVNDIIWLIGVYSIIRFIARQ